MTERLKEQLCISLTQTDIDLLRELSAEMGIAFGNRGGNISGLMRSIADRFEKGDKPFGGSTFEETVFQDLLLIAESLQQDCHLREGETTAILRLAAKRRYSGLQSQTLDNAILDIVSILFGERVAP
jgi:hypothetical protein